MEHPSFHKDEEVGALVRKLNSSSWLSSDVTDGLARLSAKLDACLEAETEWLWQSQIVGYVGEEPIVRPVQVPRRDSSFEMIADTRPLVREVLDRISRLHECLDLEVQLEILRREKSRAIQPPVSV